jgi:hypothetical protein
MLDKGGLSMLHASYGALGNSAAFQASLQVGVGGWAGVAG